MFFNSLEFFSLMSFAEFLVIFFKAISVASRNNPTSATFTFSSKTALKFLISYSFLTFYSFLNEFFTLCFLLMALKFDLLWRFSYHEYEFIKKNDFSKCGACRIIPRRHRYINAILQLKLFIKFTSKFANICCTDYFINKYLNAPEIDIPQHFSYLHVNNHSSNLNTFVS